MLSRILTVSLLLSASAAFAQSTVEATKTPTKDISSVIKPESAALDYRYYYTENNNAKEQKVDAVPLQQVRATLGFTVFSKLNTTFILAGNKEEESQKIGKRQPQVIASLPMVSGDIWSLALYTDSRLPVSGKSDSNEIGINPNMNIQINNQWSVETNGEFEAIFSGDEDATVAGAQENRSGFRFVNESDADAEVAGAKQDPEFQADLETLVRYKPAALDGRMTVAAGVLLNTLWSPEYSYNAVTGGTDMEYQDNSLSIGRFRLDYKVTENLTLTDDLFYLTGGFFEERTDGGTHTGLGRVTNRIGLSYKMF